MIFIKKTIGLLLLLSVVLSVSSVYADQVHIQSPDKKLTIKSGKGVIKFPDFEFSLIAKVSQKAKLQTPKTPKTVRTGRATSG